MTTTRQAIQRQREEGPLPTPKVEALRALAEDARTIAARVAALRADVDENGWLGDFDPSPDDIEG
jgi:hypothetical protein